MMIRMAGAAIAVLLAVAACAAAAPQEGAPPDGASSASGKTPGPVEAAPELLLWQDIPTVTGAARYEQKQSQAPASVTVITAEDIRLYGYTNLAQILRAQRSFYILNSGESTFLGVRGFLRPGEWNARVLVMVDGRPTREAVYSMSLLDQEQLVPVENIKQIEIIRGPGSALYGQNAVFAVINILTRDGADVNGFEIKGQGGNLDTGRAVATFGKQVNKDLDVLFSAARYTSSGRDDIHYLDVADPAMNYGHIEDSDYEGAGALFGKIRMQDLTLELGYNNRKRDNSSALYQTWWFNPGRMQERTFDATLRYDHKIDARRSVHAMVYYGRYRYDELTMYDAGLGADPTGWLSAARATWVGGDVHYDWQVTDQHRLVVGGEVMNTLDTKQKEWDSLAGDVLDVTPENRWWSLYAQDEYTPTDWLQITAGIRMDDLMRLGPQINPRGAIIITPSKSDVVKLLYGRAFRPPNLYELFYTNPGATDANPNLEPEVNDTYEVVWSHDWTDGWRTETSYYFWRMQSALQETTDPGTGIVQTVNDGTLQAHGVEGEVSKRWKNGARIRLSGSLGRAVDEDEHRLAYSPDGIVNVAGEVPVLTARTFLAVETQILGSMKSAQDLRSEPSYVTNVVLTSKNVVKGLDLHLGVYNLFGEMAQVPSLPAHDQPWLRHPGTYFLAGFTWRF